MTDPHYVDSHVTLYHGDCLDILRQLDDNSVDAVVTDPPYGLEFMGKEWDAFRPQRDPRTAGRVGEGSVVGGAGIKDSGISRVSFGGKRPTTWRCDTCNKRDQFRVHSTRAPGCEGTWLLEVIDPDAPSPLVHFQSWCETWAVECLRVLKPGGHMLAFGGTRTWHRLAAAIEDAGFEIRDSIAWLYGSGFPKSLDVSKAIDRAAGAEREVVGPSARHVSGKAEQRTDGLNGSSTFAESIGMGSMLTAPATPDAVTWQGWGTALKPAFEPIVVARKPLGGTVAANVLTHGTGALNIDATRVGTDGGTTRGENGSNAGKARATLHGGNFGVVDLGAGRWPANVTLGHAAGCERLGSARVKASGFYPAARSQAQATGFGTGVDNPDPRPSGDGDGTETVERWACAPGCPVADLNAQSGVGRDGVASGRSRGFAADGYVGGTGSDYNGPPQTYGGEGGASRFFPTFRYEAKAPTAERPRVARDGASEDTYGTRKRCRICGKQEVNMPGSACECDEPDWGFDPAQTGHVAHPTVKPLDLMRWLVRLVTPPGGTVLDPFAGSGTTAEACVIEGFTCITIEREADYLPLIVQRLSKPIQPDLFGGVA